MIVVNLMGGLGNQMFQYACGLSLSSATGQEVLYATDIFDQQRTFNGYELDRVFGLTLPIATKSDLRQVLRAFEANPYIRRAVMKYKHLDRLCTKSAIYDRSFAFLPDLAERLAGGGYLHGYWQSEDYFANMKENLHKSFVFQGVDEKSIEKSGEIVVSLHVRRGDYMNANSIHAACDEAYYRRALKALGMPLQDIVLHVFSDDPNWARQELFKLHPNCHFIEGNNGADSYKDMYLMSKCDHHIIANSSFSWWGAWLNQSQAKKVVAPKKWFVGSNLQSSGITPHTWDLV